MGLLSPAGCCTATATTPHLPPSGQIRVGSRSPASSAPDRQAAGSSAPSHYQADGKRGPVEEEHVVSLLLLSPAKIANEGADPPTMHALKCGAQKSDPHSA